MKHLFEVHGDHPVLGRVDEYHLTEVEKNDLTSEMQEAGYENISVDGKTYLEDGDEIEITAELYMATMGNDDVYRSIGYIIDQKYINSLPDDNKEKKLYYEFGGNVSIGSFSKEEMFPLKGKLKAKRLDRTHGHLIIDWDIGEGEDDSWQKTNVYFLEKMGFNFIQPHFEEIEITNCDDELLNEYELVIKYYALQNNISIEDAKVAISKVNSAMAKHGIVFYRP